MKFLAVIFIFYFNINYSQSLSAATIHQISQHNFEELDQLMLGDHGFKRMQDLEDENQKVYTNFSSEPNEFLVVTVIRDSNGCSNILSIVHQSAVAVSKLREELLQDGFVYLGKKKMSEEIVVSQFLKGKFVVSITDHTTSTGAYQILLVCK
jgi:hypothetical protein